MTPGDAREKLWLSLEGRSVMAAAAERCAECGGCQVEEGEGGVSMFVYWENNWKIGRERRREEERARVRGEGGALEGKSDDAFG